ncbi:phosphopantetheine-binding protein, partial [Streptomyces sp. NPDC101165]|uniref:acyl carrier protein n=1 Tax=Streptomyces sp. NPDC101165 TaxID=3366119 RepID=UPI0038167984
MYSDTTAAGTSSAAAATERQMAEVLAGALRIERVPVNGNFFTDLGADSLVMAQFCARVRKRDDLPTVSMKDVYRHPTIRSLAAAFPDAASSRAQADTPAAAKGATDSSTGIEELLAEVLATVLRTERVPVDADFFTDLGADSLVMAQFCARVRKRDDLPTVSMKDV